MLFITKLINASFTVQMTLNTLFSAESQAKKASSRYNLDSLTVDTGAQNEMLYLSKPFLYETA